MPNALQPKVLSWKEAEDLFKSKRGYSAASFYELEGWAKVHGFTVTRVASYSMLLRVKQELDSIIASGGTLAEFQAWANTSGVAWSRSYTELVYRMNVLGAYNTARFMQINDPAIRKTFEILFYDAVSDDRTREQHARMGGRSWKREEFPAGWWPPNGFNCRCEVRAVTRTMEGEAGLTRTRGVPKLGGKNVTPDQGFTKLYTSRDNQVRLLNNRLRRVRHDLGQ